MSTSRDPDRLIHSFLMEGEDELFDQVYDRVRAAIEHNPQRVVIGPWRMPIMNKIVGYGLAAAAVIAVVLIGAQLLGSPGGGFGGPGDGPTHTPEASVAEPTATPEPSPSPSATAPPLTQTFTSTQHGISMSYPEGWTARAATEPLTDRPGVPEFVHPGFDVLLDPVLTDHLFLAIASQPIGDSTPEEWGAALLAGVGCTTTEPIAVDSATGLIGDNDCGTVAVTTAGRGYRISLYASDDDPAAVAAYDRAWFEEVLATVQLHPEDAVD